MPRHLRRWLVPVMLPVALATGAAGAATAPDSATSKPDTDQNGRARVRTGAASAAQHRAASRAVTAARRIMRREARAAARRRVSRRRARVATFAAASRIGSPYASGASGPRAFDCSGLTSWVMRRAGIHLPRTSFAQAQVGTPVSRSRIRRGDLVFFSTAGPGASHVGIATSRSTVISATGHGVMRHAISDPYWGSAYAGARRVIRSRAAR